MLPDGVYHWTATHPEWEGPVSAYAIDDGERLVLVAHQAVIMVFRYVLEGLTEQQLLEIDAGDRVANTSVTRYERQDGALRLVQFNAVDHLPAHGADVTEEPHATARS